MPAVAVYRCVKNDHWIESRTPIDLCPAYVRGKPCRSPVDQYNGYKGKKIR